MSLFRAITALLLLLLAACGTTSTREGLAAQSASPTAASASCPAQTSYPSEPPAPTVPASMLTGGRLAPEEAPQTATLCRYVQKPPPTLPPPPDYIPTYHLDGSTELTDLEGLSYDLQVAPKLPGEQHACTSMGGPTFPYLLRLDYNEGTVWLSTADDVNGCSEVSNGSTTSGVYLGADAAASYAEGTWVRGRPRGRSVCFAPTGRYGQHRQLVPDGAVRLRVCTDTEEKPAVTDPAAVSRAAELLNGGSAQASEGSCEGQVAESRSLLFEFRRGRSVLVHLLSGCRPNAFTQSLSTQLSDGDVEQLLTITG